MVFFFIQTIIVGHRLESQRASQGSTSNGSLRNATDEGRKRSMKSRMLSLLPLVIWVDKGKAGKNSGRPAGPYDGLSDCTEKLVSNHMRRRPSRGRLRRTGRRARSTDQQATTGRWRQFQYGCQKTDRWTGGNQRFQPNGTGQSRHGGDHLIPVEKERVRMTAYSAMWTAMRGIAKAISV